MQQPINTDRELYALKSQPARYERAVSKAKGLSVLVFPNGIKTFVVRYVAECGARRRLAIGDYPALSLADARLKAGSVRLEVTGGADPAGARAIARTEARMGETVADLAHGYWAAATIGLHGGRKRPLRRSTIERQKQLWERHLKAVIGPRRFKDVRRADVRKLMQDIVLAGRLSPASIASIGDVLRALFTYALHEDLVEANPTLGLTRPITPQSRARLFDDEALGRLLVALMDAAGAQFGRADPHARLMPVMALALRLTILTLARRTEVAGARWAEIDLRDRIWVIPPERTKNRQFHVVPLSPQAMAVLGEARRLSIGSEWVFASPSNAAAHLDPHAMTRAVARLCSRLGLPAGSPHDFRRTGATVLTSERCGVRRFIVSKVLGHTAQEGAAVTAVYDRNDYLPEKREALEAWGRRLDSLLPPEGSFAPDGARRHLHLVSAR